MKAGLRTDKCLADLHFKNSRPFPFKDISINGQWKREKYITYLPLRGQYRGCLTKSAPVSRFTREGTFTRTGIHYLNAGLIADYQRFEAYGLT